MRATGCLLTAIAIAALGGCGSGSHQPPPPGPVVAAIRYHCPMHPSFVSDRPGDCPICSMRLVPFGSEPLPSGATAGPPGLAAVTLSPERRSAIGVRTEVVRRMPLTRRVRAAGRVEVDERRVHHVHTKFEGWIEELAADQTGMTVKRGQMLFTVYSPEVLAAQEEFRIAAGSSERLQGSAVPEVAAGARDLVEAARRRLRLWDFTEADVERLARGEKARRAIPFRSPMDGVVLEKKAVAGLKVMPGDELFTIADLGQVWVLADVYDAELPFIRVGQEATVRLSYLPGVELAGTVSFLSPTLDPATRTVRVRIELPNPDLTLRPEMYATAEIRGDLGERLVVPESALLHSGTREVAFVDFPDGRIEPREVRLGARTEDAAEVLDGLALGERVVVGANFLVDAESQLASALSAMGQAAAAAASPAGGPSGTPAAGGQPPGHGGGH